MATTKNITMKQFNGTDYDTLYPKTIASQIPDVYSKSETYPQSQLYTRSQLYTQSQIDGMINSINNAINGKARVQTGSYVGTGTSGENNPCSLTFDFAPKLVIIRKTDGSETGIFVYNSEVYLMLGGPNSSANGPCSQSNNTISWYYADKQSSRIQLNSLNTTYVWVAVG